MLGVGRAYENCGDGVVEGGGDRTERAGECEMSEALRAYGFLAASGRDEDPSTNIGRCTSGWCETGDTGESGVCGDSSAVGETDSMWAVVGIVLMDAWGCIAGEAILLGFIPMYVLSRLISWRMSKTCCSSAIWRCAALASCSRSQSIRRCRSSRADATIR